MPDTIAEISAGAFSGCQGITSIVLPNTLTKIGKEAFANCHDLKYVSLPASVNEIGDNPFDSCNRLLCIDLDTANKDFQMVDGVLIKGDVALFCLPHYEGTVTLPDTIRKIATECFCRCDVKQITLPDSLVEIGKYAFAWCHNLTQLEIPSSVNVFGYEPFIGTGAKILYKP